jgi:hypothetical protein
MTTCNSTTDDKYPSWSVELLHKDNTSDIIQCYSYDEASTEGILHGGAYIITRLFIEEGDKEYVKGEN